MSPIEQTEQVKIRPELLSHFGIKNPNDIIVFLKSPEGKAIQTALQEDMKDAITLLEDLKEHFLLLKRKKKLLHFLLALAYQEEEAEQELINQINEKINEELLQEAKEAQKEAYEESESREEEMIQDIMDDYLEDYGYAAQALEEQLLNTESTAKSLEGDWHDFEEMVNEYHLKYPALTLEMDPLHEKKLVVENGLTYLIPTQQKLQDLSPEKKHEAQLAYRHIRPQIEERNNIHKHYQQLSHKNNELQHTMLILSNQLTKIQAAIVNIQSRVLSLDKTQSQSAINTPAQTATPTPTPRPTPTPKPQIHTAASTAKFNTPPQQPQLTSTITASPTAKYIQLAYRLELLKIKNNPELNRKNMDVTQQLRSSAPIPDGTMQFLMQNIGRYNVTLQKRKNSTLPPLQNTFPEVKFNPSPFATGLKPKGYPNGS